MTLQPTALTRDVLARATRPIPRFADPAWHALPEQDLRRVAAVLIAAEAWRQYCSAEQVTADLREQLEADDALVRARLTQAAFDIRTAMPTIGVDDWWARVAAATVLVRELARSQWATHPDGARRDR